LNLITRTIHLDLLLNEFFNNQFDGFNTKVTPADPILSTPVPVVEIPLSLDTGLLLEQTKKITLPPAIRKIYPYETTPRYLNWRLKLLWSNCHENTVLQDVYYKKLFDASPQQFPDDIELPIQEYLTDNGVILQSCVLSVFEPGGYLRPHRDTGLNLTPLDYVWIPLNNPHGNALKIYPYGDVNIKLGSLYLLNQENFVHSVANFSNEDRYVLVGKLNNASSEKIKKLAKENILQQYG